MTNLTRKDLNVNFHQKSKSFELEDQLKQTTVFQLQTENIEQKIFLSIRIEIIRLECLQKYITTRKL